MKGLLFVAAEMVSCNRRKTKFRGKKKKEGGGARGDGQWEERREAGQVLLVKENLNGFGWGLVQRSSAYMWEGGAI